MVPIDTSVDAPTEIVRRGGRSFAPGRPGEGSTPLRDRPARELPSREAGRSPLFQVMMSMQNVPPHLGVLPGLAVEVSEPDAGVAKFDRYPEYFAPVFRNQEVGVYALRP